MTALRLCRRARYPFEVWIVPHQRVPILQALTGPRADMAGLLHIAAGKLDKVSGHRYLYIFLADGAAWLCG